jgi:hypothetical protein
MQLRTRFHKERRYLRNKGVDYMSLSLLSLNLGLRTSLSAVGGGEEIILMNRMQYKIMPV